MRPRKPLERGRIGRVAREHLVAQRETLGRDDQRDDHLPAIAALVSAVAVLPQILIAALLVRLKVRAGQVIQQHVELRSEQLPPTSHQKLEQFVLVLEQPVQAAVQRVLLHQPEIRIQQIGHRAGVKPLPVQPPLRSRIDQPVRHQRLQYLQPWRALPRRRQPLAPECIELQLPPQLQAQPARAPLPRPAQLQLV
jgi:hypothetical protein